MYYFPGFGCKYKFLEVLSCRVPYYTIISVVRLSVIDRSEKRAF